MQYRLRKHMEPHVQRPRGMNRDSVVRRLEKIRHD